MIENLTKQLHSSMGDSQKVNELERKVQNLEQGAQGKDMVI